MAKVTFDISEASLGKVTIDGIEVTNVIKLEYCAEAGKIATLKLTLVAEVEAGVAVEEITSERVKKYRSDTRVGDV